MDPFLEGFCEGPTVSTMPSGLRLLMGNWELSSLPAPPPPSGFHRTRLRVVWCVTLSHYVGLDGGLSATHMLDPTGKPQLTLAIYLPGS